MLGDDPDAYPLEEKWSIVQAYHKGGGVAGLHDIIDHGEQNGGQQDDEVEIDLNNPDDVKIIE